MARAFWGVLSKLNRLLPRYAHVANLEKMGRIGQVITAWRIFVTYRALDAKNLASRAESPSISVQSKQRSRTDWLRLYLTGCSMGVADLVPGVSGGTVAFIAGIYDELLGSIAGINLGLWKSLRTRGVVAAWREANLTFLLVLMGGVLSSVLALASLLHRLLEQEPERLWAFFFGLVAASVPLVGKTIKRWNAQRLVLAAIGLAAAGLITSMPPLLQSDAPAFLFICGAIAICAMILPGISGSFLLVILGAYGAVIGALKSFDVLRIVAFGAGAVAGLLGFSRLLKRLLDERRAATISLLTGFLIGSLNALWPWKVAIRELYQHSDGRIEMLRVNAAPSENWMAVATWALLGASVILGLEWASRKIQQQRA